MPVPDTKKPPTRGGFFSETIDHGPYLLEMRPAAPRTLSR